MPFITIKNIGPLTDTGRLRITPLTLIVGKPSAGKHILMKILSYCSWFEKELMNSDDKFLYEYTHHQTFLKKLRISHRLDESEFSANSEIIYESEIVKLEISGNEGCLKVTKKPHFQKLAHNLKLSYIPVQRNLLTAIPNIDRFYKSSEEDLVFNFILQWKTAKGEFTSDKVLDIVGTPGLKFYYDGKSDKDIVVLPDKRQISPLYASNGVQSSLPIIGMAHYLYSKIGQHFNSGKDNKPNQDLEKFKYQYFKLFIEEPEQNLYPKSQYELLKLLVCLQNTKPLSWLIITSHSPYILTSINILIRASLAYEKDFDRTKSVILETLYLPKDSFSAYYISDEGQAQSMIDHETSLIRGEFLDSVSDTFDDKIYSLNQILYGDDD